MILALVFFMLTLSVTTVMVMPLLRRGETGPAYEKRAIAVYRDQLDEVAKDINRGLLTKAQAEAARAEIHRRILIADNTAPATAHGSRRVRKLVAVLIAVLLPVTAFVLYLMLGSPELPGKPFAERANNAATWSEAGENIVLAKNGIVVIEALEDFNKALKLDPKDVRARFYVGLAEAQIKDFKKAVSIWKRVLKDSPPDAPWNATIKKYIDVYSRKGKFDPATVAPAPD